MTAINPAKLKIQCVELSELYSDPEQFIQRLHELFDFYAVRVRKNRVTGTILLLQSYQVSPPVMRALELELVDLLNTQPSQGLILIDTLWEQRWVETRALAVSLLGSIPPINPDSIFKRIKYWTSSCESDVIRSTLTTRGVSRLSKENPELVLNFFHELTSSPTKGNCQAVLFGLVPFASDHDFDNLPRLYKLLNSILLVKEKGLVKEILALLKTLIKRSEQESLYFLERQLSTASKPRILRVIRQILPSFSAQNQVVLKKALKRQDA